MESEAVTTRELEACLRYTLQARLSPTWNSLGSYLVKGTVYMVGPEERYSNRCDVRVFCYSTVDN
jgi:hypothetical protein